MQVKEAIILAGGLGTRLRDAVPDLPKSMAPIRQKPFISYLLDYLLSEKIEKFIFSLGYRHQVIEEYIAAAYPGLNCRFAVEHTPLGTGGGIRLGCELAQENTALVVNGDTFFKVNVANLAAFHQSKRADCTLALKPMKNFDRYGVVELDNKSCVQNFKEKKFYQDGLINGGVYLLNLSAFLSESFPAKFSFEKDYLEKSYHRGTIYGFVEDDYFIDIGIPEDFERAQRELVN